MRDTAPLNEILACIINLINTSPDHKAWFDQAWFDPYSFTAPYSKDAAVFVIGPLVRNDNHHGWVNPAKITLDDNILHIGKHSFDLNDPASLDKVTTMFGCDEQQASKWGEYTPASIIASLVD